MFSTFGFCSFEFCKWFRKKVFIEMQIKLQGDISLSSELLQGSPGWSSVYILGTRETIYRISLRKLHVHPKQCLVQIVPLHWCQGWGDSQELWVPYLVLMKEQGMTLSGTIFLPEIFVDLFLFMLSVVMLLTVIYAYWIKKTLHVTTVNIW